MKIIKTTQDLASFCDICADHQYVTLDTEFLRERTYYSKLCLIQLAYPGDDDESACLIDVLSEGLSLDPLYALFQNENVVKVFHAARQDLEIFFHDKGIFPRPFFDTQVAAMVCGYGEQVGYEKLVRSIAGAELDKSSRFTDWSQRPLSDKQMKYAIGDVTHLRVIYETLRDKLAATQRAAWVEEEVETLLSTETYITTPEDAWRRVKTRNSSGKFLAVIQKLAAFREQYAQDRNIPRNRVYKDDAMIEIAAIKPNAIGELSKLRLLTREARKGDIADGILKAISDARAMDPKDYPKVEAPKRRQPGNEGLAELLRVLLKAKAEEAGVAQRLIAATSELEEIASGNHKGPIFKGWRKEVFGADAAKLCAGKVALAAKGRTVKIVEI